MSAGPVAIVQNAYLVPDLERACEAFNRTMGFGPFIGGAQGVLADHVYRGEPAEPIRIRGIFAQSGQLNVELVEVVSDAPSAFHDMLDTGGSGGGYGLHHCAYYAADYEAEKQRFVDQGFAIASEFGFAGHRICYVDTRPWLGHMIEIYPDLPLIRAMYAEARDAATERPGEMSITPFATPR